MLKLTLLRPIEPQHLNPPLVDFDLNDVFDLIPPQVISCQTLLTLTVARLTLSGN